MTFEIPQKENAGARIKVTGRVQMVGFRWFTVQWAQDLGLSGWVKNMHDGSVLIEAEGEKKRIESLIKEVKIGPRNASVKEVKVTWLPFEHRFRDFKIRY
jgi:acylphosphatase